MTNNSANQLIDALSALTPGDTFKLSGALAVPTETITKPDKIIYTYASTDPSRPHLIHTQNGVITFIQITLGNTQVVTIDTIRARYGEPESTAYSAHSHDSLVYSYPSKGFVFITDNTGKNILLAQQFPITSQQQFAQTVGKDFTKDPYGDILPSPVSTTSTAAVTAPPFVHPLSSPLVITFVVVLFLALLTTTFIIIRKQRRLLNHLPANTSAPTDLLH